jgi:DNA replication protein DnaD
MDGYIKLYRKLLENPIWNDKPFSKGQAWTDMMFRCNHTCRQIPRDGGMVWILRGQFVLSNYKLAEAWGWSESSVRVFLKLLSSQKMLTILSTRHYTLYEVTKYCVYQSRYLEELEGFQNAQETHKKRTRNAQETPNNILKNDKNDKKLKKVLKDIYVTAQNLSMSKDEYDKLTTEYGQQIVDEKIEYAKNYKKLSNYTSLYLTLNNWLKADRNKQPQSNNPFL